MKPRPPWEEKPEEWYEFEGSWHRRIPGSNPFGTFVVCLLAVLIALPVYFLAGFLRPLLEWLIWR
jgi:hypothetical protein